MTQAKPLVSIIVPVYNEAQNIPLLHQAIIEHVRHLKYRFEFVFVDDGSRDNSAIAVARLHKLRKRVRLIQLSRNFGKEAAVTAGLHAAKGVAAIILDADLQHPPNLIADFIKKWEKGAEVVVGIKRYGKSDTIFKRLTSAWFYRILQSIAHTKITPHAADYRLLDRRVINEFGRLTEHNRLTRGLIDWLGFRRAYVRFDVAPRMHGQRSYTFRQLFKLAINSLTAYSLLPLKLAGYLGLFILLIVGPAGAFLGIQTYFLHDPMQLHITGTAMLAIMMLFLIGLVLACLGLVALYIAHIHAEVTNRPLYIVRRRVDEGALNEETVEESHLLPATAEEE